MSRMLNLPGSGGSGVGLQPWVHRLGLPVTVHPGFVTTGIHFPDGTVTHTRLREQGQPQVRTPLGSWGRDGSGRRLGEAGRRDREESYKNNRLKAHYFHPAIVKY